MCERHSRRSTAWQVRDTERRRLPTAPPPGRRLRPCGEARQAVALRPAILSMASRSLGAYLGLRGVTMEISFRDILAAARRRHGGPCRAHASGEDAGRTAR